MNDQNERRPAVLAPEMARTMPLSGDIWQAMIDAKLTSVQRIVFLYVWWMVEGREWRDEPAFWTVDDGQIVEAVGAGSSTVRRAIARLVELGFLVKDSAGRGVRSRYLLGPKFVERLG